MTSATTYNEAFFAPHAGEGGPFLIVLSTRDDLVLQTTLGVRPGGAVVDRKVEGGGPAEPLGPFASTTFEMTLFAETDADLEALAGLADNGDDYCRVDYYRMAGGARVWHEFSGFLEPEAVTDYPGRGDRTVSLTAQDGVGTALGQRLVVDPAAGGYDAEDPEALLETLRRTLRELGTADDVVARLVSRCGIRPTGDAGDPLARLHARAGAWVDGDDAAQFEDAAARVIASATGCRLFQTRGLVAEGGVRYVVQQRSLLAADPTSVVTRTYDVATGALIGTTTEDILFDAAALTWAPDAARTRRLPVASVDAVYSYGFDLDQLVANASFEEADGAASDPAHWSTSGASASAPLGASYCDRVALPTYGIGGTAQDPGGLEPTVGDDHALRFTDDGGLGFARPVASQGGFATIPREDGSSVRVEARMFWTPAGNFTDAHQTSPARLRAKVNTPSGVYSVHRTEVSCRGFQAKQNDVRVPVSAVLSGFGGALVGVPVALPGTVLRFVGNDFENNRVVSRLTLTRPLLVGSTSAVGDLDEDVYQGSVAAALFFAAGDDGFVLHDALDTLLGAAELTVSGNPPSRAVDGTHVEGGLVVWFEGAKVDPAPPEAARSRETWHVGSVTVAPRAEGGDAVVGQADRVGIEAAGLPVVVPETDRGLRISDGPLPDSAGALLFGPSGGPLVPTARGDSTSWSNEAEPGYAAGSHGEALARDVLRQLAGLDGSGSPAVLKEWTGVVTLGGAAYDAERALRLTHPGDVPANYFWNHMRWDGTADALYVAATQLRLADVGGSTHEVELLA